VGDNLNRDDKGFAWDSGVVEGEGDREGCSLTVCELRTGAEGDGRSDDGKQNCLIRDRVR